MRRGLCEANGAIMADVCGRLTGKPAVCLTTAGPGATNCVTALAQAYAAASPVMHVSATVPTKASWESLHGVDDEEFLSKVFKSVSKWSTRVEKVDDISPILSEAYRISTTGRMGPVHINIPVNILASQVESPVPPVVEYEKSSPMAGINEIVARLLAAERLVIYAGKNISSHGCEGELLELCELLNAPVVTPRISLSILPHDHKLYAGFIDLFRFSHPAAWYAIDSADLILSIGVRLGTAEAEPLKKPRPKGSIHIDVEKDNSIADYCVDKIIEGNFKENLKLLLSELKNQPRRELNTHMFNEILEKKDKVNKTIDKEVEANTGRRPIHPGVVVRIVRSVLERNAIVTNDVGNNGFWVRETYNVLSPKGLIEPGVYAAMGFSLPAAICAKLVYPERQVLAATGDGGLLMSYADLPTVLENNLGIVMLVFNDSKYSAIWHIQRRRFKGHFISSDLQCIDFSAIFRACGGKGVRVEEPGELRTTLEEALSSKTATLIDVITDFSVDSIADRIYTSA